MMRLMRGFTQIEGETAETDEDIPLTTLHCDLEDTKIEPH